MLRRYREALEEACRLSELSGPLLEAAIASDFGDWIREERLPKPPSAK